MRKFLLLLITLFVVHLVDMEAQQVSLNLPVDGALTCGQEVTIPVTVTNYTNINTLQFQVEWDPLDFELVTFDNLTNILLFEEAATIPSFVSAGVLSNPSTLIDGSALFTITLRAISDNSTPSEVFISDIVTLRGTLVGGAALDILRDTTSYSFSTPCMPAVAPTISCPMQNVFTIGQGQTSAVINGLTPTINNDNGAVNVLYNLVFNNVTISNGTVDASGETFNIGTTTLTYLLVDAGGNIMDQCDVSITLVEDIGVVDNNVLIGTASADCTNDAVTCVDINMGAVQDISDLQFAIEWDTALLILDSGSPSPALVPGAALGLTEGVNGVATFSYFDLTLVGKDFVSDENLLTLCFQPKADGVATLAFTNNINGGITFNQSDGAGGATDITSQIGLTDGSITVSNCNVTTPPPTTNNGVGIGSGIATCGQAQPTCVNVTIDQFQDLANIQFSVNWDPTILQFVSHTPSPALNPNSTNFGLLRTGDGILNFSWFDLELDGQDFMADEVLFTLCYNPLADGNGALSFSNNETPIEINQYDAAANQVDVTDGLAFSNGGIQVSNCGTTQPPMPSNGGFSLGSIAASCGQTGPACIDVTIAEFQDLANIQFSVNWDPSVLQFVSATNNDAILNLSSTDYGLLRTGDGILNFSWFDLDFNGQDFAANDVLFTLCFNPLADGDAALTFSNSETPIEVNQYDASLEQVDITDGLAFSSGAISITNCGGGNPGGNGVSITSTTSNCDAGTQACVDVLIGENQDLANIQFSVNWDPSILRFVSATNNDAILNTNSTDYGLLRTSDGILNFSWFDLELDGQDFNNNDVLFTLCFDPLRNGNANLTFSNNETPIKVNQYTNGQDQIEITDNLSFSGGAINISGCPDMPMGNGVSIGGATIDCSLASQETCVDVNISEFQDLANIQFSVNWDIAVLQFVSVSSNDNILNPSSTDYGLLRTGDGILNFSWFDLDFNGQDFANGDRLFTLCFLPVGQGDAQLRVSNNETPIKVNQYDASVNQFEITDAFDFSAGTIAVVDTVGPTISNCPTAPIVVYTTADNCQIPGSWTEPTFADACNTVSVQQTNQLGDIFGVGDQVVQYTGVDGAGNIATCSFVVSVRDTIVPTVLNCPQSTSKDVSSATDCDATVTWTPPTATDACTANPIITANFQPGDAFPRGVNTVRYNIMDSSGNINNSCAFTVEITGEAPVRLSACPDNIARSFSPETGCDLRVTWIPPVLVGGCSVGQASLTSNFNSGDEFPVGTTTVTYTASDEGGNTETCSFEVSLTGSNPINFPNCPGNITVNSLANQCGATVGWAIPTPTGGCGEISQVTNFSPNDFFPVGVTTVSYNATDATGDQETCTFVVEVVDDQSLVVLCPQDIMVNANGMIQQDGLNLISNTSFDACGSIRIEYRDIEAFDNCSSTISRSLTQGLASNSLFSDTTQMSIDVSNASGESVTCAFRIIVEDQPVFAASLSSPLVCSGQPLILQSTGISGASYTWSGPNGFISMEQNPIINDPSFLNTGEYTVIAMVPGGCTVSSLVTVNVNEGISIEASSNELSCGGGTIELTASGDDITSWEWTGPNSYSALEQNPIINNATALQTGIYVVTGTGPNGCTDQVEVDVEIATIDPPTVQAAGILNVMDRIACQNLPFNLKGNIYPEGAIYSWSVTDPAGGLPDELNDSLITVQPTEIGQYAYTYTVDLGNGCVADTSIVINVIASPTLTLSSNAPILCADEDTLLLQANVLDTDRVDAWSWVGPNGFSSPFQFPLVRGISAASAGDYIVTASSSDNGCVATDTIAVEISDKPAIPSLPDERMMVCEGNSIIIMPSSIDTGVVYNWTGPNGFMASDSVIEISNALMDASGGYQLVQSIDGCDSDPATTIVSVLTEPDVNDDEVFNLYNESAEFEVISNDTITAGAGFTINILNDGSTVSMLDNEAGTIISNGDGSFTFTPVRDWIGKVQFAYEICYEACPELCGMGIVTIDTDVSSEECIVPGVLSPNGDDKNDALIISCNSDPPKGGGIMIFNQWGAKVYESFPYNNDWIGTYQGEDLPDGVYYYIFNETDDSDPVKGCITIFR